MTKQELREWQRFSIKQARRRLTEERFTELMRVQLMAGYVA